VTNWSIRIPYSSRGESLIDVASNCRRLGDAGQRAAVREIAVAAKIAGLETASDLLDVLSDATTGELRVMLDAARKRAGLPTTGEVEAEQRFEDNRALARRKAAATSVWQICPIPGCNRAPVSPLSGAPIPSTVKRWHCDEHRHLATPRDLEPNLKVAFVNGRWVDLDEQELEDARGRAAQASRQAREQANLAEARIGAAEHVALEQARQAQVNRELPPVYRGHGA
jgi:hypothetical protein